jgi:hypothetical protein
VGFACIVYLFYEEPLRVVVRNLLTRRRTPVKARA